jgi:hypothetical protein
MTTQMQESRLITDRVDGLVNQWRPRNAKMKDWYDMIRLNDHLKQDGMESVISPDPRTSYNMALYLLTPRVWSFEYDKSGLNNEEIGIAGATEQALNRELSLAERKHRSGLFGTFLTRVMSNFLSTGWIAFASWPAEPWRYEAWNPATVYPEYDNNGDMTEVARKYYVTAGAANSLINDEGWVVPAGKFTKGQHIRMLFKMIDGECYLGVMVGQHVARPMSPVGAPFIPVYMKPGGGLPDDGSLVNEKWREEIGQAVVALVEDFQKNYDKMLTYMQQLLKDTANPKWVERVHGEGVLTPENIYKRGSIYTIEVGEDIFALQAQGAPVDLRGHSLDLKSQLGRAQFPDISFGNFTQQVSAFLMSASTASTQQLLWPFQESLQAVMGDSAVNNLWLMQLQVRPFRGIPASKILFGVPLDYRYEIEIPGDFINRANSARIVNPDWRLSSDTTTRILFPEIQTPALEQSKAHVERALNHPMAQAIEVIQQMYIGAAQAEQVGDLRMAELLRAGAETLRKEFLGGVEQQPQAPTSATQMANIVRGQS